uniref:T-complex protein theta SU n=1 Tax=Lotharella vacuolata TaxID=74820 RepID=A0A0H5BK24_9EUKA|nr:T-complex protein theta SU [Lotharella vacuolata]
MKIKKIFTEILVSESYYFSLIFATNFGPMAKKIIIINPDFKFFCSISTMSIIKKISLHNPVFEILKFVTSLQFGWINDGIGQLLILSTGIIVRLMLSDDNIVNNFKLLEYVSFLFITIFNNIYKVSLRVNFKSIFHLTFLITKSVCFNDTVFLNIIIVNLIKIVLKGCNLLKLKKNYELCIIKVLSDSNFFFKITNGFTKSFKNIKTFPFNFYYKFPKTIFIDLKSNNIINSEKFDIRKKNYGFESFKFMFEYKKIKKIFLKLSQLKCNLVVLITFLSEELIEDLFINHSKKMKMNIIYDLNKKKSSFIFKYLQNSLICNTLSISNKYFFYLKKVSCFKSFKRTVITFEKIKENEYISILLIENSLNSLKNLDELIIKITKVLKALFRFPYIIPGGGSVEIYSTVAIMERKKIKEKQIATLIDILSYGMLKIPLSLSKNAEWGGNKIIQKLIKYHSNNYKFFGQIMNQKKIGNVIKEGVFDILLHKYLIYYTTYEFLNLVLRIDENFLG